MDNGIDIVLEEDELEVEIQADFLKGDKGDPGYTPVRGIDYYTEQDKQELIDELTEDIQGVKNDFNTNVATKTNEFNANVVSKTTEFNNNATNKMAEFNANTITKINEYNENAEDLINRVIEAEAENERLRNDLSGLPTGQAEGETIDITDSAEMRFSEFNVRGNSKQETVTDNLFNNTWEQGVIASETGIDTESTTMIRSDYIKIYPNHLYSISRSIYSSYMSYRFYDKDKKYLGNHIAEGMMTYSTSDGRMNENESSMTFTILNTDVEYMRVTDGSNNLSTIYTLTTEAINPDYPSEVESCGDNVNLIDLDNMVSGYVSSSGSFANHLNQGEKRSDFIKVSPNTSYTFKIHETSQKNNDWIGIGEYSSNDVSTFIQRDVKGGSSTSFTEGLEYTITTSPTTQYIVVSSRNLAGATKIKLEEGSTPTPYSPYGQGCINEVVCNKNMLDISKGTTANSGLVYYEDDKIIINASTYVSYTIEKTIRESSTYALSFYHKVATNSLSYKILINGTTLAEKDVSISDKFSIIRDLNKGDIITIQLRSPNGGSGTFEQIMLCKGTNTAYIPHQSQTFSIPTQQPMRSVGDARDTFVKVDGKRYERHNVGEVIFNGSENWSKDTSTGCYIIQLDEFLGSWSKVQDVSTHWICNNSKAYANTNGYFAISNTGLFWVGSSISTLDEFKTWLLNNNVKVLCRLATPIDIECTPEQVAILDEIENTVKSYKGVTHIYSTDEVSPNVEVTYKKDIETLFNTLVESGV